MITKEEVENIYKQLELLGECAKGIMKPELLESAINGQYQYNNIFDKYLHVGSSINKYHIFNDGNKRTCYLVIKELEKYRCYLDDDKLSDLILQLARSEITKEKFMEYAINCIYKY